jgi:hypothetical protein
VTRLRTGQSRIHVSTGGRKTTFLLQTTQTGSRVKVKVKVKFRSGALQNYSLNSLLYSDPHGVPSFISRGAAHQAARATSASAGRNYRWNLANNPVIHFKVVRFFYMPQSWDMRQILLLPLRRKAC